MCSTWNYLPNHETKNQLSYEEFIFWTIRIIEWEVLTFFSHSFDISLAFVAERKVSYPIFQCNKNKNHTVIRHLIALLDTKRYPVRGYFFLLCDKYFVTIKRQIKNPCMTLLKQSSKTQKFEIKKSKPVILKKFPTGGPHIIKRKNTLEIFWTRNNTCKKKTGFCNIKQCIVNTMFQILE